MSEPYVPIVLELVKIICTSLPIYIDGNLRKEGIGIGFFRRENLDGGLGYGDYFISLCWRLPGWWRPSSVSCSRRRPSGSARCWRASSWWRVERRRLVFSVLAQVSYVTPTVHMSSSRWSVTDSKTVERTFAKLEFLNKMSYPGILDPGSWDNGEFEDFDIFDLTIFRNHRSGLG